MKRAIAFAFLFLLAGCGFLLADTGALPPSRRVAVLEEIARLTHTGASDDMVLAYAQAHRRDLPSRVSDADLQWLRESGVRETVVRYLRAIDVRIPDGAGQEGVTYGPGEAGPRRVDEYTPEGDSYGGYPDNGYVGYDSYPSSAYDEYPYYSGWSPSYYSDWYYPYYPYYSYYPYYPFYAFNRHGFHGHGHGHDGHFDGNHHGDGGHGDGGRGHRGDVGHGRSGDTWRDRGSVARRTGPMTVGSHGSGRPSVSRGNVAVGPRGPRGGAVGHGGSSRAAFSGGGPHGSGGPRGGAVGHGGVGHSGPSGGHAGGGYSGGGHSGGGHSGGGHSGGGHSGGGPTGGHGRR